jgi:FkbM family methyltransferase
VPGTSSGSDRLPSPRVRNAVDRIPFLDKELFVLRDFLPEGGVMVDVGAAGGVHAVLGARAVGPDGRVVAIEARPGSAAILRRWRTLLGLDQLTVLSTAIGAEPGSLDLRTPLVPTRSHSDDGPDATALGRLPGRVRTVGMTTLDLVVAAQELGRLDLLKVDVEGAEPEVLAGGAATIERFRPVVVIEIEERHLERTGRSGEDVRGWLVDRGYRAHVFDDEGLHPVDAVSSAQNNYVFLPDRAA